MRDTESLTARIRQLRRFSGAQPAGPVQAGTGEGDRLDELAARVAHLEQLLEGLQDSVHRESARQGKLIADLQAQVQPKAMGEALSRDVRERKL
jgi:uncharacterized coiled-coil protein SlyX